MQLTRLSGLTRMDGGRKSKEVARGGAKGKRRSRNGGQKSNVIQWVDPNEQMKVFTAANGPKGKKATGAGTKSTSTRSTSALSGPGLSTTPPLDLTSHTLRGRFRWDARPLRYPQHRYLGSHLDLQLRAIRSTLVNLELGWSRIHAVLLFQSQCPLLCRYLDCTSLNLLRADLNRYSDVGGDD
jgi:hypothetical protein